MRGARRSVIRALKSELVVRDHSDVSMSGGILSLSIWRGRPFSSPAGTALCSVAAPILSGRSRNAPLAEPRPARRAFCDCAVSMGLRDHLEPGPELPRTPPLPAGIDDSGRPGKAGCQGLPVSKRCPHPTGIPTNGYRFGGGDGGVWFTGDRMIQVTRRSVVSPAE